MTKIHKKRLLKLAQHLERGKLGHDKFDFNVFHKVNCKTAGCAVGECPILWPRVFRFGTQLRNGIANVYLKRELTANEDAAALFFGLTGEESSHLFIPTVVGDHPNQQPELFGGRVLGPHATRKQVASNIRAFLKKKEEAK